MTVGWSGGGPHGLACAALLPGRCLAAASLAGVAPAQAAGLDWTAGMGPENVAEFAAARQGGAPLAAFLEEAAAGLGQVTGQEVADELGGLISAADRSVVTAEFADYLACSSGAALRAGIAGGMTTSRSLATGVSRWIRLAPSRSPSGRGTRTGWSRSGTASGSRLASRARGLTWPAGRAI